MAEQWESAKHGSRIMPRIFDSSSYKSPEDIYGVLGGDERSAGSSLHGFRLGIKGIYGDFKQKIEAGKSGLGVRAFGNTRVKE